MCNFLQFFIPFFYFYTAGFLLSKFSAKKKKIFAFGKHKWTIVYWKDEFHFYWPIFAQQIYIERERTRMEARKEKQKLLSL